MRTLLICHDDAHLIREGMGRWLASFSDLAGIVVIKERNKRVYTRIKREIRRVGLMRFPDVVLFRIYHGILNSGKDQSWEDEKLAELRKTFPADIDSVPVLETFSPNSKQAKAFILEKQPDLMIARCKTILRKSVYSIPGTGTFVMHPGICPEYRNAHGCFWALANDDLDNVGMTLLKVDEGVDTGSVYGYYSYDFDELNESHHVIQERVVWDNLKQIEEKLLDVHAGEAVPLDTSGRKSATWGQPWLSAYLRWKLTARRRAN